MAEPASLSAPAVRFRPLEDVQILSIKRRRGREIKLLRALKDQLGFDPPAGPRRSWSGPHSLLGVGPGAWLLVQEGPSSPLHETLAPVLAEAAAVCDQSDGYAVFALEGAAAWRVLAKGAPVDLDPAVFGLDAAAVTVMAHMGAVIWRSDAGFRVAVFTSYRESFAHWLAEAAAEFMDLP